MEEERAAPTRPGPSHTRELRILNRVAEALNSTPDAQQALERTLALVAELLGLRTGWVWLLDPETGQFYSAAALNLPPYLQEPVRMAGISCWCTRMFRSGELAPANIRLLECSRLLPAVEANDNEATAGLSCHASLPLYFQDRPLGIMNVTAPSWRQLTPAELRLLATIAHQVGIAIERARLAEEGTRLARAEERARLAREIHDTLAQSLTAIALNIEGAMRHLKSDPELARERLERALSASRAGLEEARRSVLNLRTPLEGKPLPEALRALGRAFTAETGIRVRLRVPHDPRVLPLRAEAELYRIAQEALANVARHARATAVVISLRHEGQTLRMAVRDNGAGFDARYVGEGGQGILGMRERARLLGGRLRVTSRPGRGTSVGAVVPLPAEQP